MNSVDLDLLFKLRLSVARFGEMDGAKWWNTNGILGRYGALALQRGFPKTHYFAQAKIVFTVATQRCREVFPHPNAHTLWALPSDIEDQFDQKWHEWVDEADNWTPVFKEIENISGIGLPEMMLKINLATPNQLESIANFKPSSEGNSIKIDSDAPLNDHQLIMLAAGFSKGQNGKLIIPYLSPAPIR